MSIDQLSEIESLIRRRRTIVPEDMTDKDIPEEILLRILESANWAPTHGLTEPWRFRVYTGKGRKVLGDLHAGIYKKVTEKDKFIQKKYDKLLSRPQKVGAVITIGMEREKDHKIPEIEEIAAVSCAVQNMMLTATQLGVGSYWGSGGMTYHKKFRKALGLSKAGLVLGILHLGYTDKMWPEGKRKSPIDDKISWVKED